MRELTTLEDIESLMDNLSTTNSIGEIMNDTKMSLFVPINKVDEEQRMVYGIASSSSLDKQNEIVDWAATKEALEDYSQWRNIREMHKPSAVGTAPIIELRDKDEQVYIGAKIIDDQAWAKCKEGVYKGFSIGGEVLDRKVEFNKAANKTVNRVTKYLLNEISIVDRPANPVCRFQTIKRDTTIETVTIAEDPLKAESSKLMEKAIGIAKRSLSKAELEALPDEKFGLIKVVADGDRLIKHRQYPMPDKTHAVNMLKKMSGCEDLSEAEKGRIHTTAVAVLGKKHVENECSYCITKKLEGDKNVENIKKAEAVVITDEPKKKAPVAQTEIAPEDQKTAEETATQKPAVAQAKKPAEAQKPHIQVGEEKEGVDEEAPIAGTGAEAPKDPIVDLNSKMDQVISLLSSLLEAEKEEVETESEEGEESQFGDDEAGADAKVAEEDGEEEEEDMDEEEDEGAVPASVDAKAPEGKTVEEVAREEGVKEEGGYEEEDEACKTAKTGTVKKVSAIGKAGIVKKMKAIMEPLVKENASLKARLEKLEKSPLPRKGAVGTEKTKIEKFESAKEAKQDMTIVKSEITFSDELKKDIEKASTLRKSGKALSTEETAFCQRVAERMLEEKSRRA